MIEKESISPFGEIRSALDILSQHVVRVDNVVKGTDILASMQNIMRNVIKTQVVLGEEFHLDGRFIRYNSFCDRFVR